MQGEVRLRELLFRGDVDTDIAQLAKIFQILGTRRGGREGASKQRSGVLLMITNIKRMNNPSLTFLYGEKLYAVMRMKQHTHEQTPCEVREAWGGGGEKTGRLCAPGECLYIF